MLRPGTVIVTAKGGGHSTIRFFAAAGLGAGVSEALIIVA